MPFGLKIIPPYLNIVNSEPISKYQSTFLVHNLLNYKNNCAAGMKTVKVMSAINSRWVMFILTTGLQILNDIKK